MNDENEKIKIDENNSDASRGDSHEEKKIASRRKSIVGICVALGAAFLATLGFCSWRKSKLRGGVVGIEPMRTPGEPSVPDDGEEFELMGDVVYVDPEAPDPEDASKPSDPESESPADE